MKNLLYVFLSVLIISCEIQIHKKMRTQKLDMKFSKVEKRVPLNAGDLETIKVWEKYVTAHNNKDLETIKNLNHDDIKILTPGGEFNNSEDI